MKILLSHISVDKSLFEFKVEKDKFDIPELTGDVIVRATAYQTGEDYTLNGNLSAKMNLICDRCLEPYEYRIGKDFEVIFTSDETIDKDDNIMFLPPQDVELDLKPYVRDTLLLEIPYKKVCSDDCKGLCVLCGENLNVNTCSCDTKQTDPRWDSLKKLKETLESAEE